LQRENAKAAKGDDAMSMAFSFLASLTALSLTPAVTTEKEVALEHASTRFADVLVTSYTCELLGFEVDYEGLADRGEETRARLVAAGFDPDEALSLMQRDIQTRRNRFNQYQGGLILWRGARLANNFDDEALYRFQKTFTNRCTDLAGSGDVGAFFGSPEERLSGADLVRKILHMARTASQGA